MICTHRPVVRKGWREEYVNVFGDVDTYRFVDDEESLRRERGNCIYFASIQDLRGSQAVSGKFAKNATIFRTIWDLVIIDEAHEGTQTELGAAVIDKLTHGRATKILALSGTPYNIMGEFPVENTYTWDYVAEAKAKRAWDETNGCANPYAALPEMHIFTYMLSEHFRGNEALVSLDNSFSFGEFFRVSKATGRFVHEGDVRKFLALLCGAHAESNYPFATAGYREALRHTLWKLPGVQECVALKELLDADPVFGNFEVVNVAGEGDVEGDAEKALDAVKAAIARNPHTITLSCGRLTTGVTVPQWTGVLMLSGGDKVAAAAYLQTIFRVQSPHTDADGRVKEACYAFDFAPDRLLAIVPKMCIAVLTPWRVVNRHLADTLGGWCFYDAAYAEPLDAPRLVAHGAATQAVFGNPAAKVLELNAKSGLYPLWVAFAFYQARREDARRHGEEPTRERQLELWREAVRNNLYVVCRTKMARAITTRTLLGYNPGKINVEVYEDIVADLRNHAENNGKVLRNIRNPATWGHTGATPMHFNAIVGNPPYQASLGGASPLPIYHHFVNLAIAAADLVSLITPSRWFSTGTGLDDFREERLKDTHFRVLHDFRDSHLLFGRVDIKGGVNYFLWDKDWDGEPELFLHESDTETRHSRRRLLEPGLDIFVRDERVLPILRKVLAKKETSFATIVSAQDPFGFDIRQAGSMRRQKQNFILRPDQTRNIVFYYNGWRKEGKGYVARTQVKAPQEWMDCIKVFLPKVWGTGDPRKSRIPAFIVEPPSVCTETYLTLTPFATRQEAENALRYIETKFFHFLVGIRKTSQNGAKGVYRFVPLQDFTRAWTDVGLYARYGLTAEESAFIEQTIPNASAARPSRERRP